MARAIRTGSPEWRTTVSVTLPNAQRLTPEQPWVVHMAIRLSGVWRANEMISSAARPSLTIVETLWILWPRSALAFSSRYALASSRRFATNLFEASCCHRLALARLLTFRPGHAMVSSNALSSRASTS